MEKESRRYVPKQVSFPTLGDGYDGYTCHASVRSLMGICPFVDSFSLLFRLLAASEKHLWVGRMHLLTSDRLEKDRSTVSFEF